MDDVKGKTESPVIGISLNAQFSAGRTVVFQTHVPQEIEPKEWKLTDARDTVGVFARAMCAIGDERAQVPGDSQGVPVKS